MSVNMGLDRDSTSDSGTSGIYLDWWFGLLEAQSSAVRQIHILCHTYCVETKLWLQGFQMIGFWTF